MTNRERERERVLQAIRDKGGSATIADIKAVINRSKILMTSQDIERHLVAMANDGLVTEDGKNWRA